MREIDVTTSRSGGFTSYFFASASTYTFSITSGYLGGSPRVILSTCSMPSITWPHTVYLPVRKLQLSSVKQM